MRDYNLGKDIAEGSRQWQVVGEAWAAVCPLASPLLPTAVGMVEEIQKHI